METYYSHGKLLLTGEYAVLDGAHGLAIPTRFGQQLTVVPQAENRIVWISKDNNGHTWFTAKFGDHLDVLETTDRQLADRLLQIFKALKQLNPGIFKGKEGLVMTSALEFPRNWGLGSSSTLINNLAQWAAIDPYLLLERTFGGSGYDVACAQSNGPLLFSLDADKKPCIVPVSYAPAFSGDLFFVHLNNKQDSRKAIAHYRKQKGDKAALIQQIDRLTTAFLHCTGLSALESIIAEHEAIMAKALAMPPVKERLFPDFPGAVKSLGAWGGDFVLATGLQKNMAYFKHKGFTTIIPYADMVHKATTRA